MKKPILCLDFDGVVHSYASGWKGAGVIPDPPVDGALDFITNATDDFTVAIYSSRSGQRGGIEAMQEWLMHAYKASGRVYLSDIIERIKWPTQKPPAFVTIDDRAITFTGEWPSIPSLLAFQPWYKKP